MNNSSTKTNNGQEKVSLKDSKTPNLTTQQYFSTNEPRFNFETTMEISIGPIEEKINNVELGLYSKLHNGIV